MKEVGTGRLGQGTGRKRELCSPLRFSRFPVLLLLMSALLVLSASPVWGQAEADPQQEVRDKLKKIRDALKNKTPAAKQPVPELPEQPSDLTNLSGVGRDAIDEHLPINRDQLNLFRLALRKQSEQKYQDALKLIQKLLTDPEDSVYLDQEYDVHSMKQSVRQLLKSIPVAEQKEFVQRHEVRLNLQYEQALENRNLLQLTELATRWSLARPGQLAANKLASHALDRGDLASAVRWLDTIWESNSELKSDPRWLIKYAVCLFHKAKPQRMDELISLLDQAPQRLLPPAFRQPMTSQQWLRALEDFQPSVSSSTNATMASLEHYGNAGRKLTGPLPDVVLQPSWTVSLSQLNGVRSQLKTIREDLGAQGIAPMPMASAVVNGDIAVVRSMVGLEAFQTSNGQMLWQRPDDISAERLLMGQQATRFADQQLGDLENNPAIIKTYDGDEIERHPLTSLMYRNGIHHSLSSDQKRVFAIVDHAILSERAPGMIWNFNIEQRDSFRRSWSTNRLIALNLKSGRQEWSVGGPKREEQFDDPSTGTLFLGTPTCVGGTVYCIGEQEQLLRLFAISAQTGEILWQQSIGMVDVAIDRDLGRRWWCLQPTLHQGMIICPTGLGYLTAVDLATHEIAWMTRYAPIEQRRSGRLNMEGRFAMTEAGTLHERWPMVAPLVTDDVVCIAPSDVPLMLVFDLKTGELKQTLEKEDGLYVAGIYQNQLVVVMNDHLQLIALPDFNEMQRIPFVHSEQIYDLPCGRPVMAGHQLWLPFQNGSICEIDLRDYSLHPLGQISHAEVELGNLFIGPNGLVSVSGTCVSSMPEKSSAAITNQLELAEFQFSVLRQLIKQLMTTQQFAVARQRLANAPWKQMKKHEQDELLELLIELESRAGITANADRLESLEYLLSRASRESHQQIGLRMKADQLIAMREPIEAFWTILQLINSGGDQLHSSDEGANWMVSDHVWAEEKLEQIWNAASGPVYSQLQQRLSEFQSRLMNESEGIHSPAWSTLLTFRISAGAISPEEIPQIARHFSTSKAESYLLQLMQSPDEVVQATACLSLGKLMSEAGLKQSALRYLQQAQSDYWEVTLTNGQTVREYFDAQPEWEPQSEKAESTDWSRQSFELIAGHDVSAETHLLPVEIEGKFSPFMQSHRIEYDPEHERLLIRRLNDGSVYWSVSLPSVNKRGRLRSLEAVVCGHQLTLVHRGMACSVSLIDRRMIWTERIDHFIDTRSQRSRNPRRHLRPLHLARTLRTRYRIGLMERSTSPIVLATPEFIVLHGRTEMEVRSAFDGRVLWRRRGISSGSLVSGDQKALLIVNQGNVPQLQLLRTSDGKQIYQEQESEWIDQCVALVGHDLIIANAPSVRPGLGVTQEPVTLSRYSFWHQETVWSIEVNSESFLSLVDDEIAVELTSEASLESISLKDGHRELIEKLPPEILAESNERACVRSGDELYVQFNKPRNQYFQANMETVHVKGLLYAYQISTLLPIWKKPIELQECHWVMEDLESLPVLVFLNRKVVSEHGLKFVELSFQLVDRQTGKMLFNHQQIGQSTLHSFQSNLATKELYFSAHNSHYRIRPKQKP